MEIFNNQERSGYEEIVSYGPKWFTDIREMNATLIFAGWTLDLMAYWLEQIVRNQYPMHADEIMTRIYEMILKIEPEPGDTLAERRRTVAAYWSGIGKLSETVIKSIIKNYSGCESELWWDKSDTSCLQIRIYISDEQPFSNRKIYNIISRRMPAHISFLIREVMAVFELKEEYVVRPKYRFPFLWWNGRLDGSYQVDGSYLLSVEYPTTFRTIQRVISDNPEGIQEWKEALRFGMECPTEEISLLPKIRIEFPWWEGQRMVDGGIGLDGSYLLDQDRGPLWPTFRIRSDVGASEEIGFNMYIPAKAARMNGATQLDGNIFLNSGREVL